MCESQTDVRHYPNDSCGDPEHDAILEAWYARAEALLDRGQGAAPRAEGLDYQRGYHDASIDSGYHGIEFETCANAMCEGARLSPQERRDKEGTE